MNLPNCAGRVTSPDDDLFFDEDRGDEAKAICAGCQVSLSCLAGAVARGETSGWWSGVWMGPDLEDFLVAEPARIRVAIPSRHGTRGAYQSCKAGEDGGKCRACSDANNAYAQHYRHDGPAVTRSGSLDLFEQLTIGASA